MKGIIKVTRKIDGNPVWIKVQSIQMFYGIGNGDGSIIRINPVKDTFFEVKESPEAIWGFIEVATK